MVTPPQKNGSLINSLFGGGLPVPQIADDGADMMAISLQCMAGTESCTGIRGQEGEPYEFARTGQGWVTHPLAPSAAQYGITTEWAASANTHTTLFSALDPTEAHENFYTRAGQEQPAEIGPVSENGGSSRSLDINQPAVEATGDFSHTLFADTEGGGLWSLDGFPESPHSIYEYAGHGARPLAVGVEGPFGSTTRVSECPTYFGGTQGNQPSRSFGSLSVDGRVVFFSAEGHSEAGQCSAETHAPASNELLERVDNETPGLAHTVLVSAPTPAACSSEACHAAQSEPQDAEFEGASSDGSRVFFTSAQQLSDNASNGPGADKGKAGGECHLAGGAGCNLYESVCALPCGTQGEEPAAKGRELIDVSEAEDKKPLVGGAQLQGVMAISSDGSHVYFVARGKLADNPGVLGSGAVEGQDNLYVYTTGRPLRFIATLPPADEESFVEGRILEWDRGVGLANVTPDGRFLVFESHAALTADDTRPEGPTQIYRYDAQTGQVVRISVGQHGFNDNGNAGSTDPQAEPTIVPAFSGFLTAVGAARGNLTMSDDGQYVFFQSPVALTPGALNEVQVGTSGQLLAGNVYEYHDGNVSLISDGKDTTPNSVAPGVETSTRLLGVDRSGRNVFFATASQVTPQDTDTNRDYYVARICEEASPCVAPPVSPGPGCQGEACHPVAGVGSPVAETGGSDTFTGPGDRSALQGPAAPAGKPRPLTRAQKLARALKACRTKHNRAKRASCERQARRAYGANARAKKARGAKRAGTDRRATR